MTIAISDDHLLLAETAADLLASRDALAANRALLNGADDTLPEFWNEVAELGWLGIHLGEDVGGSGFGIEELVVLCEELGAAVAPGPFAPTVIASALVDRASDDEIRASLLPSLADGSAVAGLGIGGSVTLDGDRASGSCETVLSAGLADQIVVAVGDDVAIVAAGDGVSIEVPPNLDPSRPAARVTFDAAPAVVLAGAAPLLTDLTRLLLSAEAVGVSRECTRLAADYARERQQFGRVIGTFQAVKHHCANMAVASELAVANVWDAARAAETGGAQFSLAASTAAVLAAEAADLCANLNTQVHGGIAMTWEADAHLFMRRASVLQHLLGPATAAADATQLNADGVDRGNSIELPDEAEAHRAEVRAFVETLDGLDDDARKERLLETGYAVPNWPTPYGRAAGAIEQLVIEEEFRAAGVRQPALGITGWNILTIIGHGTDDQRKRWVMPALRQDVSWCQLFSEPDAGSDAAGIKTRGTRVEGGWLVTGQKVWTSGAQASGMGFATVRTNPDVKKHDGITMMAIDMHAEGVEVRPLVMTTGHEGFNEVFFDEVFVADDDVVGPEDGGWAVARATLGFESVSIGGGRSTMSVPPAELVRQYHETPERLPGGPERLGRFLALDRAIALLNLRAAHRAVAGGEPGPEGAMTKLVLSEIGHESVAISTCLAGPESLYLQGRGAIAGPMMLMHRGMSIAGGTSEVKRNQIGERILGLPRDPLIK
ncbi:MAG: acyl-CoA dehydrogenase [Acidimicrobiales bacterium]|nr:acyl-CoA dehydrogenase [Acidimicrobiales bacterium]